MLSGCYWNCAAYFLNIRAARRINVTSTDYKNDCQSLSWKAGFGRERFRGENDSYADDTRCVHRKLKSLMSDEQRPLVEMRVTMSRVISRCARIYTILSTSKTEKFFIEILIERPKSYFFFNI